MGLQLRLLLAVHSHATMLQQRAYLNTSENEEDADDIFSLLLCRLLLLLELDPQLNFLRVSAKEATFLLHVVIVVVAAAALLLYWGSGFGAGRSIKPNDVQPPK